MKSQLFSVLFLLCAYSTLAQTFVYDTIQLGTNDSIAISADQLTGPIVLATNFCQGNGAVDFNIVDNGQVLEITPISVGLDTACILVCDAIGMCDTTYFYINAIPNLCGQEIQIASIDLVSPSCGNGSGGAINIVMAEESLEYDFSWNEGLPNASYVTGLQDGNYNVVIAYADNSDCFIYETIELTLYDDLEPYVDSIVPAPCYGFGKVALGPTDAIFNWHDGATGHYREDLVAGTYQVTVSKGPCLDVIQFTIWETAPNATIIMENSIYRCFSGGATLQYEFIPGDDFILPYETVIYDTNGNVWENGNLGSSVSGAITEYFIEVYDANGCQAVSEYFEVTTVEGSMDASVSVTHMQCDELGSITTTVTSNYGPYEYHWSDLISPINTSLRSDVTPGFYSVTIVDQIGCELELNDIIILDQCQPIEGIWPGDADSSGIVDLQDLLNIGLAFGSTGPSRINPSIDWLEQVADYWSESAMMTPTNVNYRHIDSNGDGQINDQDTLAISQNFGLETSGFQDSDGGARENAILKIEFASVSPTGEVTLNIYLGSNMNPVDDFYGATFTLDIGGDIMLPASSKFTFADSWISTATNELLTMQRSMADGLAVGFTRKDQKGKSGFGKIGAVTFQLQSGISLPETLQFNLKQSRLINADGDKFTLNITEPSISTASKYLPLNPGITLFPNPASEYVQLQFDEDQILENVILRNIEGKTLSAQKSINTGQQISLQQLANGIYYLHFEADGQPFYQKIVVLKN